MLYFGKLENNSHVFAPLLASSRIEHLLRFFSIMFYYAYFQHAHFISIVGVGKERRILIGP